MNLERETNKAILSEPLLNFQRNQYIQAQCCLNNYEKQGFSLITWGASQQERELIIIHACRDKKSKLKPLVITYLYIHTLKAALRRGEERM